MKAIRAIILTILVVTAVAGCVSGFGGRGHGPVESFQFLASGNSALRQNLDGTLNEQGDPAEIYVVVPPGTNVQNLAATLSLNIEAVITVISSGKRVEQQNGASRNDFSVPVLYSIEVPKNKTTWKYRVTVREAETNAALASLSVTGAAIQPAFSSRVKEYAAEVPFASTAVRLDMRGQSTGMKSITVDGTAYPGSAAGVSVDFRSVNERSVLIETLAEDGETSDRYTVAVRRGAPERNALLSSLEVADQPLAPSFSPSRNSYQAVVPYLAQQVVLRAKTQSKFATIALATTVTTGRTTTRMPLASKGNPADAAGAVIEFTAPDELPIILSVTAQDGSVQEYLVEVARAAPDRNNDLQLLELAGTALTPAFKPGTISYSSEVPYLTDKVTLLAKAQSVYGKIALEAVPAAGGIALAVKGDPTSKTGAEIAFTTDRVSLSVTVTAQDGSQKRYLISVRRAAPDRNADLQLLTVANAALVPAFKPGTVSYVAAVPYSSDHVTVFAGAQSVYGKAVLEVAETVGGAAFQVKGDPTSKTGVEVAFTTDRLSLYVAVTAQDGSQKRYLVEVRRAAPDRNADLGSLTVSSGALSPAFSSKIISYTVILPATAETVQITAAAASSVASVGVEGQALPKASSQTVNVSVPAGKLVSVNIFVTAEDGTQKLYRVQVSREAAAVPRDSNTRLASLHLAGAELTPAFNPSVLAYDAVIEADAAHPMVAAQAESLAATVMLDGQPLPKTGVVVVVSPGAPRTVLIEVTAENGAKARTTLRISREGLAVSPPRTGTDRVSVSVRNLKLDTREAASLAARKEKISSQARITVRAYRTGEISIQETVPIDVKQAGSNVMLDLEWRSSGLTLDRKRMVEVEVGIPTDKGWLCYTEAFHPSDAVSLSVPFLLYAADPRVIWPGIGQRVNVAGYVSAIQPGKLRSVDRQDVDRDAKGEYGISVEFTDGAGKRLAESSVMIRNGLPREYMYVFVKPVTLIEGSTVGYLMSAKLRNGEVWQTAGTTEIWSMKQSYEGGFEPVVLQLLDDLVARK